MQKWEYLSLWGQQQPNGQWFWADGSQFIVDPKFNELGAQGWELVTVTEDLEDIGSNLRMVTFFFKRPSTY